MGSNQTDKDLAARTNEELAKAVADTSAAIGRREALQELARRNAPKLSAVARWALDDPGAPRGLRHTAAVALGKRVDPESEKSLVGALSSEDTGLVRLAAASLGKIGDRSTLGPLRKSDGGASPPARRAISFARSLISYRLGLPEELLRRPPTKEVARFDGADSMSVRRVKVPKGAFTKNAEDLQLELPRLPIASSGSMRLSCRGEQLWVVLAEESVQQGTRSVAERSCIPAVVLKLSTCPERWYVHEYLMTHPGDDGSIQAFGMRPSGQMNHFGGVDFEADDAVLTMQALNVAGIPAIAFQVGYADASGELTVREALTSISEREDARKRLVLEPVHGLS
ncbi:MAG: HEAT repeat domain-containing protein [Thermoanaerobaculia bacterium]